MNGSNKVLTFAYVLFALLVVCLYVGSHHGFENLTAGLPAKIARHADYVSFAILSLSAALVILFKGAPGTVLSAGTIASLICLTSEQEPLVRFLTLGGILFAIGMYGMVASRNAVRVLMSIELMLTAVTINLVAFARYVDPIEVKGQVFAIFILTVAAAEAAVGLAIVLSIYRNTATVDMERFNLLKW